MFVFSLLLWLLCFNFFFFLRIALELFCQFLVSRGIIRLYVLLLSLLFTFQGDCEGTLIIQLLIIPCSFLECCGMKAPMVEMSGRRVCEVIGDSHGVNYCVYRQQFYVNLFVFYQAWDSLICYLNFPVDMLTPNTHQPFHVRNGLLFWLLVCVPKTIDRLKKNNNDKKKRLWFFTLKSRVYKVSISLKGRHCIMTQIEVYKIVSLCFSLLFTQS